MLKKISLLIALVAYILVSSSHILAIPLDSKVIYSNPREVSISGAKPNAITTSCIDAIEHYWNKFTSIITAIVGEGNSTSGSGALSPEIGIDFDKSSIPANILSGTSKEKFNWLFDGNGGMAYNTTEAAVVKYMITIDIPIINQNGQDSTMKVTVHKKVAGDIIRIFEEIKEAGFKIRTTDTGAYNWRGGQKIGSSGLYSMHCLGIAIDINWNSNYAIRVNTGVIEAGTHWKPGEDEFSMPADGIVVKTFKKYGWKWGGDWNTYKDYMHFSLTGN